MGQVGSQGTCSLCRAYTASTARKGALQGLRKKSIEPYGSQQES